jgi:hypothetical protein
MAQPTVRIAVPSGPLVDVTTGEVTPAWRAFLIGLYGRTGGAPGGTLASAADLLTEQAAREAADAALSTSLSSEEAARAAGDAANATAVAAEQSAREAADARLLPTHGGTTGTIGFQGAAPIGRPVVTGAKGGNTALASLLSALASYGLLTDTTT